MKSFLPLALIPLALSACSTAPGASSASTPARDSYPREEVLSVNSAKKDCMGVVPMKCLEVRRSDQGPWELFYGRIEGFDFVPGHEYQLRVRVERVPNPPADASSLRYSLIEILRRQP